VTGIPPGNTEQADFRKGAAGADRRIEMKKVIIGAAVFVLGVAAIRRFGPALRQWALRECQGMFDRMPEEFPPKQMLHSIEEVREQNQRILRALDEEPTALAAASAVR
jgi:hypothetical protein